MTTYKVYNGTIVDGEYPSVLYKYRDWKREYHDRYLKKREIFMAPASSFEDEKDCKIPIRYDLLNQKQTFDFTVRLSKLKYVEFTRQQHRENARQWAKRKYLSNEKNYKEFQNHYFNEFDKRLGVLCLTEFPCLEKMWNDYANNSKGFIIGYNSKILFEYLGGGGKVTYDELPIIFLEPIMPYYEIHHKQVFYKEKKWDYENEYRTFIFYEVPATREMRQIELPKEAFNKIILGKNISVNDKKEIIETVYDVIGNIPIVQHHNFC